MPKRKFSIFDIDITYYVRPNDDIYQETKPKEISLIIEVPDDFDKLTLEQQVDCLKMDVIEDLYNSVSFDTADEPYFEIEDVEFCFEEIID